MDAETGLATEERRVGTTAPGSRPARRFRLGLATLLMLVVASAPALALYAKIRGICSDSDPDRPAVTLLAIVLTGIVVGVWRRASPGQVIAQIGLACVALLALFEIRFTRLLNYWLAMVVAVTIVVPLLARSQASATQGSGSRSRRVASAGAMLLNVALNLFALALFCFVNTFMNENIFGIPAPLTPSGNAIVMPAPAPMYAYPAPTPFTPYQPAIPVLEPVESQPAMQGLTPAGPQPADDNKDIQEEHS